MIGVFNISVLTVHEHRLVLFYFILFRILPQFSQSDLGWTSFHPPVRRLTCDTWSLPYASFLTATPPASGGGVTYTSTLWPLPLVWALYDPSMRAWPGLLFWTELLSLLHSWPGFELTITSAGARGIKHFGTCSYKKLIHLSENLYLKPHSVVQWCHTALLMWFRPQWRSTLMQFSLKLQLVTQNSQTTTRKWIWCLQPQVQHRYNTP